MRYVVMVSHGQFANGLKDALMMLAGQREDVIASGLENGKSADEFAQDFEKTIDFINQDDEIILLGDLIGGSPLTTAMNVIHEKNMDEICPMASTTKIMTAIVVIENSNLNDIVTVSKKAAKTSGSRLGLKPGDKIKLLDLLYGLLLPSGNDAAYALAEHTRWFF